MIARTPPLLVLAALCVGSAIAGWAFLGPERERGREGFITAAPDPVAERFKGPDPERIQAAVARGLAHLRRTQDPASGGWIQDVGYKRGDSYVVTATAQHHVGVSSLALMAFLAGGHLPGRGLHGSVVTRGADYVLSQVHPDSGYISNNMTRMYSHAFATLFLAEIYGMTHRVDVKEKLQRAVDLIVRSQNDLGSWRYQPYSTTADMSITVCQIMALRAARNVGLLVPRATIDRAFEYVEKSAYRDPSSSRYGGFSYKLGGRNRTTFALTAAGIATLNHAGVYDHDLIQAGIGFLRSTMSSFNREHWQHYFYYYGHYYASQVFFLCSDEQDDHLWEWYWTRISDDLLSHQQSDGSWPNTTGPGCAFATAVACIILQIPNQYLPIFHR
jgi:hypothetical protein